MPFISTEEVKKKRNALKKEFPNVKFSITCRHYTQICVNILEAPFDISEVTHRQVNQFYIKDNFKNSPELCNFLLKVKEIINEGNYTESEDSDYGNIPSFYIHIEFGKWDVPYKKIG
jgi:hypothetical protein